MGCCLKVIDAILFIFFLIITIGAPLLDSQAILPQEIYPKALVDLQSWFGSEYGDYLGIEKPNFFVGLVWMQLLFSWPLAIANLFAIVSSKSWFNTTCLIHGVSTTTSMVAILSELILSGRASDKLLMVYYPFLGFAVLAVLRGLVPASCKTPAIGKRPASAGRKKRA